MRLFGADVIKVAVTARALTDTLPCWKWRGRPTRSSCDGRCRRAVTPTRDAIWLAVDVRGPCGRSGSDSRVGDGRRFRFRSVGPARACFGVVTERDALLSPMLHNAAFAAAGLDAVYVPLQTMTFDDFLQFASPAGSRALA